MTENKEKGRKNLLQFLKGLPRWVRAMLVNGAVLVILALAFFLIGNYMYGPAKTARAYYEAQLSEDWNTVYDCSKFPKSAFLSRQNFVNAKTYKSGKNAEDASETETAEMTSYMMRKKSGGKDEASYQVNYSLKNDGQAHIETIRMVRGEQILKLFSNWYMSPDNLYVSDVLISVPADARLIIDGMDVTTKYKTQSQDENKSTYQIPYLFLGWHTIELKESGKENYREVFEVKDGNAMEFIPDLQLNNKSGKEISERAEKAIGAIYKAASEQKEFSQVSSYFSGESTVQAAAEKAYDKLCAKFSTAKRVGISTMSITAITTSVTNKSDVMNAEIEVDYTAEEVYKWWFFFYKTKNYSDSMNLTVHVSKEDSQWVFDQGIIGQP